MKRLLAFVLLLAVGVIALRLAIGDEAPVRADGPQTNDPARPQPPRPPGVNLQSSRTGASVSQSGTLDLRELRDVPLGDGRVLKQTVYTLHADDSQPVGEGLQRLAGVTLRLFENDRHAATVTAREAFVELGSDANGQPTIREQKDLDLRDAVLVAEPGSKLAGLRLELGDTRVRIDEDEIHATTLPEQPVTLTVPGERPFTLTGRGARTRLPRERDRGPRRTEIEILADPVLTNGELRAAARGRMRYVEDVRSGAARITLDDAVRLDLAGSELGLAGLTGERTPAAGTAAAQPAMRWVVRGDQFTGWLQRTDARRGAGDRGTSAAAAATAGGASATASRLEWQRLLLVGAPATVDGPGLSLATPRLASLPGPLGDPFALTAYGGESRVTQTELRAGTKQDDPVVGVSPRRIQLLRPGDAIAPLYQGFGFPRWTLRSLDQQQVVAFEGDARLESGARTLTAQRGLRTFRRADAGTGIVQGFGIVRVEQPARAAANGRAATPELRAAGNDGFELTVGPQHEWLRLGPAPPADEQALSARLREHRYDVRHGDAHLEGVGACTLDRRTGERDPAGGDGTSERIAIALLAPFDEIHATLPASGAELRRVHELHAELVGRTVVALDVGGLPVHGTFLQDREQLVVRTPRLTQIGPHSLRLSPQPTDSSPWSELSELDRTPRLSRTWTVANGKGADAEHNVEVSGPRIDVHRVGGRQALIDAQAVDGELPQVYARLPQAGIDEPTTVACTAERLRILPFVLTPEMRRAHLAGIDGPVADTLFHSLGRPWLLVDRVREFALDDAQQGHVQGTGKRLLVAQGGAAALFVGDPDDASPAHVSRTTGNRTITMQGAAVRVYRDDEVHLRAIGAFADRSVFLAPTMTLHEPGAGGLLSNMRAVCRGNIDVDPDAVRFGAPVETFALQANGADDPEGPHITAEELAMQRAAGEVVFVTGKTVVLDWSRLDARAASMDLDLRKHLCVARDPEGADVTLPDGRSLWSPTVTINYDTWSVSTARMRMTQRHRSQAGDR